MLTEFVSTDFTRCNFDSINTTLLLDFTPNHLGISQHTPVPLFQDFYPFCHLFGCGSLVAPLFPAHTVPRADDGPGLVKERKEMYDALTSQNKEQARMQAQLGAQLQEGVNSLSDSSSVRAPPPLRIRGGRSSETRRSRV